MNTFQNDQNEDFNGIKGLRKFQNVSNHPGEVKPAATRNEAEDIIR